MSDHHGLPHDLPEYVPNRPVKAKARVYKTGSYWGWHHDCGDQVMGQGIFDTQPMALRWALYHLERCA